MTTLTTHRGHIWAYSYRDACGRPGSRGCRSKRPYQQGAEAWLEVQANDGSPWLRYKLPSATCLDGSPAAFYLRPPAAAGMAVQNHSFVLFMEGGGWCTSAVDCVSRTQTSLGSSHAWAPSKDIPGSSSMFDGAASRSGLAAEFASKTLVSFQYCDGASFAGERSVFLTAAHGSVRMGKQLHAQGSARACISLFPGVRSSSRPSSDSSLWA